MSRIGKKLISLPDKVSVDVKGAKVIVKGPKGTLEKSFVPTGISVKIEGKTLQVVSDSQERLARAKQGMTRALINNMVMGVTNGFTRDLEITGVGYKAELTGKDKLTLALGFSHPVVFPLPAGISAVVDPKQTKITLSGIDRELLGQTAANLRGKKPPEPYKGKGIKYAEERIRMKEGKAGAS
jgi:large subunit ribosomal protein L6